MWGILRPTKHVSSALEGDDFLGCGKAVDLKQTWHTLQTKAVVVPEYVQQSALSTVWGTFIFASLDKICIRQVLKNKCPHTERNDDHVKSSFLNYKQL